MVNIEQINELKAEWFNRVKQMAQLEQQHAALQVENDQTLARIESLESQPTGEEHVPTDVNAEEEPVKEKNAE